MRDNLAHMQTDINSLAQLKRNHYYAKTDKREKDVSHSYSVAMIAWMLYESEAPEGLSLEKIQKYALLHDFVEIHAGDVNTFATAEARTQKVIDERKALDQILKEYKWTPDFSESIMGYEKQEDQESIFVWTCDKIQGLLHGQMDNWRCYYEIGVTNDSFVAKIEEFRPKVHPSLRNFFDAFTKDCTDTYNYPSK